MLLQVLQDVNPLRIISCDHNPHTQPVGFSFHTVPAKTQSSLSMYDRDQILESLMQSVQIILLETVSDRRTISSTCKSLHTLPEQQNLVVFPCKPPHQKYH